MTQADRVGSNGVVHKINAVLLPSDVVLPLTVAAQGKSLPSLSTLCMRFDPLSSQALFPCFSVQLKL